MSGRRRLDAELVRRGLVPSRQQALEEISAGRVTVAGAPADKAARLVSAGDAVVLHGPPAPYVSRGGEKLAAALDAFTVPVAGVEALDAGASTGGFTDCLLQRGAAGVVAVDVGRGQIHERLRADPRVTVVERTNLRHASLEGLGRADRPFPLVVADLSFISLRKVAPALLGMVAPASHLVLLVKPQFEAGRRDAAVGKGVVSDPEVWRRVLVDVRATFSAAGAAMMGLIVSPLLGARGNVEFLAHFLTAAPGAPADVEPGSVEVASAGIAAAVEAGASLQAGGGQAPRGVRATQAPRGVRATQARAGGV